MCEMNFLDKQKNLFTRSIHVQNFTHVVIGIHTRVKIREFSIKCHFELKNTTIIQLDIRKFIFLTNQ